MSSTEPMVVIYTDGACRGNPGPGGWGARLEQHGERLDLCGGAPNTTNNKMELMGAIKALESLQRPSVVELHTDSEYMRQGITSWIKKWKRNGWKTAAKKPVKNQELWIRLDEVVARHEVRWFWVKGHAGHPGNEAADQLANRGLEQDLLSR